MSRTSERRGATTSFEVGGVTFTAQALRVRSGSSWNHAARRRLSFDGFELRCPGAALLVERCATEAEARARAAEVVKGWAPETLADVRARQVAP
jgi:hypothetical protein